MRIRSLFAAALVAAVSVLPAHAADADGVETAMVFIANYNNDKEFLGWGSGFFVDEGIVVTNKHVVGGGDWYIVYGTDSTGHVDFSCRKNLTKSDVKINLEDDVAYMRVFLSCPHASLDFGPDPLVGDALSIAGFPYRGSVSSSLDLLVTTGSVLPTTIDGWLRTDARLDFGNSGGPVIADGEAIGVAVAKGVDEHGDFVAGYFIPASVALDGLLYANDSRFGYAPQKIPVQRSSSSSSRTSSSSSSSTSSRSNSSSTSSRRSSSASSRSSLPQVTFTPFQQRTCERVYRLFSDEPRMLERVNERLARRFGFVCAR